MTPEELARLNEACCVFAGIEPKMRAVLVDRFEQPEWIPEYPPISTDGSAMLRLMEALEVKGYSSKAVCVPKNQRLWAAKWVGAVLAPNTPDEHDWCRMVADTAPMALALAVRALADATRQP